MKKAEQKKEGRLSIGGRWPRVSSLALSKVESLVHTRNFTLPVRSASVTEGIGPITGGGSGKKKLLHAHQSIKCQNFGPGFKRKWSAILHGDWEL